MIRLPFVQIDAFADAPFTGNPAAVVPLEAWPDDSLLGKIAMENNLSETAFFVPDTSGEADYELRWFTPETEVQLCGHATLASGHYLLSADESRDSVTFRTRRAGTLRVSRDGNAYAMALPAWRASEADLSDRLPPLGLSRDQVSAMLAHDSGYSLIVVEDAALVTGLAPDFAALANTDDFVVIVSAPGSDSDIISRVFAPGAGLEEDPVTGSAHAVLTPYWADRLGRDRLTAFQASARGGRLDCRIEGDRVVLTGKCVTVIEGTLLLPEGSLR
ncbi:PhzF family phenazine biosynthesis protein [Stakelama pacifica]|uniref:PhzF family phenazine biosynthesis protein n=1 Tax=Stakelama pacifica TaxID=517720 RepID=A0A4R6FV19_9SPHN|nr:PhzF family phenazine biosynthesis protein [Stakelama pacifica]TDN85739.1 PhzF family phenazine biosynthesis protein [Stakelama pacifica]GGO91769.1 putative isomerase [Stakelama pacifica]